MRESGIKLYSLGIVLQTKPRNTRIISVIPIEDMQLVEGDKQGYIVPQKYKYDVTLPDAEGKVKTVKLEGNNIIEAEWWPFGEDNRTTAPDVVWHETVKLYRYRDTDKYYWTTLFIEPNIRRLETVIHQYGNLKEGNDPWDMSSSYYTKISTHDQIAEYQTCKSNGEQFAYTVQVDSGNGTVTVKDDAGNSIILSSNDNNVTIQTNEEINLKTKYINNSALLDITNKANASIINKTRKMISTTVDLISEESKKIERIASLLIKDTAPKIELNGSTSIKITAPSIIIEGKTKHTGDMKIIGNLEVLGTLKIKGDVETGALKTNGSIKVNGTVTASKFILAG